MVEENNSDTKSVDIGGGDNKMNIEQQTNHKNMETESSKKSGKKLPPTNSTSDLYKKEQSDKYVNHKVKYMRKSLMGINNLLDSAYARLRPLETIFLVGVVLCCTTLCLYVTHKHLELQNIVKDLESRYNFFLVKNFEGLLFVSN